MKQSLDNELGNSAAQEFRSYKNFIKKSEAEEFAQFLKAHDIPTLVESTKALIDSAIIGKDQIPRVVVKIQAQDFQKANDLIAESLKNLDYNSLKDHYLNQLKDEELRAILLKPDEWSVESVEIAKILLKARGIEISEQEIQQIEAERIAKFQEGKAASPLWLALYGLAMTVYLSYYSCCRSEYVLVLCLWKNHSTQWTKVLCL